jgi:cell fate (sporulation/competence/biofilm development) regulator YmcA (YheA/YmcA/DUF963 family)
MTSLKRSFDKVSGEMPSVPNKAFCVKGRDLLSFDKVDDKVDNFCEIVAEVEYVKVVSELTDTEKALIAALTKINQLKDLVERYSRVICAMQEKLEKLENCEKFKKTIEELKEEMTCPISKELIAIPITMSDGFTYEHDEIQRWMNDTHTSYTTSPMTREVMHRRGVKNRMLTKIAEKMADYRTV